MDSAVNPPTAMSRFLALPAELRLLIYESLLVAPENGEFRAIDLIYGPPTQSTVGDWGAIGVCSVPFPCKLCMTGVAHVDYTGPGDRGEPIPILRRGGELHPTLLRCSRLIYREAMPILYGNTKLIVLIDGRSKLFDIVRHLPVFPCRINRLSLIIAPPQNDRKAVVARMLAFAEILEQKLGSFYPHYVTVSLGPSNDSTQEEANNVLPYMLLRPLFTRATYPLHSRAKYRSEIPKDPFERKWFVTTCRSREKLEQRKKAHLRDTLLETLDRTRNLRTRTHLAAPR